MEISEIIFAAMIVFLLGSPVYHIFLKEALNSLSKRDYTGISIGLAICFLVFTSGATYGFWWGVISLSMLLTAWFVLLPIMANTAARRNVFFTFIKEGTAKIILYGKEFHYMKFSYKKHILIRRQMKGVFPIVWIDPDGKEMEKWIRVGETAKFKYEDPKNPKEKLEKKILLQPWDVVPIHEDRVRRRREKISEGKDLNKEEKVDLAIGRAFYPFKDEELDQNDLKYPAHIETIQYEKSRAEDEAWQRTKKIFFGFFGNVRWIGFIFLYHIFTHRFQWVSQQHGIVKDEDKVNKAETIQVAKEEEQDFILLQPNVYVLSVLCASKEGIKFWTDLIFEAQIINPYMAYFGIQKWNESTLNELGAETRTYMGNQKLILDRDEEGKEEKLDLDFFGGSTSSASFKYDRSIMDVINRIRLDFGVSISKLRVYQIRDINEKEREQIMKPFFAEQRRREIETTYEAIEASPERMRIREFEGLEESDLRAISFGEKSKMQFMTQVEDTTGQTSRSSKKQKKKK